MSAPIPSPGDPNHPEGSESDHQRAAAALRDAFTRLQPQGSDAWNFLGAFTHLGDRYGPYHPGASALSDLMEEAARPAARRSGRLARLRPGVDPSSSASGTSELEEAMGHVVEAFRFLSARVNTLEERLAYQDHPIDGPAWLAPAQDLGGWVGPIAAHVAAHRAPGDVVHGDCGDGELLKTLTRQGLTALGVEPRGAVALSALEQGCLVTISEVLDHLSTVATDSLGGLVLSGVVDRLPLHRLLPLLAQARRVLALDAPLVVVASDPTHQAGSPDAAAGDLIEGRPLHAATWDVVLDRAGFVGMVPLSATGPPDGRFAVAASTPA